MIFVAMILKTLVLGASMKPQRHSYRTILALLDNGFPVVAVGPRQGEVAGIQVLEGFPVLRGIHTISLYLKPEAQHEYVDYILSLRPRRIIFNKKTYNPILAEKAIAHGIRVTEDCTLVMLAKGMYEGD